MTNKSGRYRNRIHKGLFEYEDIRSTLSDLGDSLSALERPVDFGMFRPLLEEGSPEKKAEEQCRTQVCQSNPDEENRRIWVHPIFTNLP